MVLWPWRARVATPTHAHVLARYQDRKRGGRQGDCGDLCREEGEGKERKERGGGGGRRREAGPDFGVPFSPSVSSRASTAWLPCSAQTRARDGAPSRATPRGRAGKRAWARSARAEERANGLHPGNFSSLV